ncbi:CU044_5270 family protein [Marinactinospora rubrisoli]|uniref:CU044_5270 family protein n=1 Tax=Marinactinospora rubrisoli TaxID=2715399 RepID=A0ABW2KG59_9ACTN
MNTDERAVRDLLAAHDPAAGVRTGTEQLNAARIDALARAQRPGRPRTVGRPGAWRRLAFATAAGAVAVAAIGGLVGSRAQTAYAGPPPAPLAVEMSDLRDARAELLDLAERAEGQETQAPGGDVSYLHTSTWSLVLSHDLDTDQAGWGVLPEDVRAWRDPDGSGLVIRRPDVPDHLAGDERPVLDLFTGGEEEYEWDAEGEGGLRFVWEPGTLSTDPGTLAGQLIRGAGWSDGQTTAGLFYALAALYDEQPVAPAVQGAALRMLAERDDVRFAGAAEDRSGRPGLLFLVRSDEEGPGAELERRIMFDAETGMPIYTEIVQTETAEPVPYDLPAVNSYTMFRTSAWVPEVRRTP